MIIIIIVITDIFLVLIRGSLSVRIAIDIIIHENFSLSKTSKITLDIPTIISNSAFTNSYHKKMDVISTNCKNIFDNDKNTTDNRHRISLLGYVLPDGIKALASLLQLLTTIHAIDKVITPLVNNNLMLII